MEASGDDWRTPAERAEYRTTPDYAETMAYLARCASAYPELVRIETFGRSGEGRDLHLVVCSEDGVFDPEVLHRSGRPILLVQNSIHAGEMDGKDACLALLRDLLRTEEGRALLGRVVFAFIPVYNVDGHERRSPYHRINQNGPEAMGWRANATNLNLNRDYLKAQAPETRAFLRLFHRWLPDFFVDNHVTDGADFQYDVTFVLDDTPDVGPSTAQWIRDVVRPELVQAIDAAGHRAFPGAIFLEDETDPARGLAFAENPPRLSTGQMILENRPGLLVELHMLKDYRTRVTGNYALLRGLLAILNRDAARLIAANRQADRQAARLATAPSFPLAFSGSEDASLVDFSGIEFTRYASEISGATAIRYGVRPWNARIPIRNRPKVDVEVRPPAGYIIPPPWTAVIDVLRAHELRLHRTTAEWTGEVGRYHCSGMRWPSRPFEGRFPILRSGNVEGEMGRFGRCELVDEVVTFPAGSVVVPLAQRLAKVALHWLEPEAPDSALRWGFFAPIFEQKESGDAYVVERLAQDRLAADPELREEFAARLASDPGFAASASARLDFFYQRSPWGRANRVGEYPIGRLPSLEGLPLTRGSRRSPATSAGRS
ncbi:MAG TPA: M14 family metallopeptidase [Thermoplasmata archaeon]|nr:M14 family metallopeptidase [Thermoplasmata archaeon]